MTRISEEVARAEGLREQDVLVVRELVEEWRRHHPRNILRDEYYLSHRSTKDLGVSVSKQIAKKLNPHVDWAAKCVDWWADRVQFEGITMDSDDATEAMEEALDANDMKNTVHKAVSSALRHSCSFLTVTRGDIDAGEPSTVVSAYPATAASALWDDAKKRIRAGLVLVASARRTPRGQKVPVLFYVFTDTDCIVLSRNSVFGGFVASYIPHNMGRVPMEPIAYHATLGRPFGRSRITQTVMDLVDDAQREMMNMTAAASFSAWPQKYLLGADTTTAEKIGNQPFNAFIGSLFVATTGKSGQIPQFGQLAQLSMQPHIDYMRSLASQFSGTTGVPLSSLGVVSDNPSSAEAIYAGKEDAVVDIQSFIEACKHALKTIAVMIVASETGETYGKTLQAIGTVSVNFRNPAMPSVVSQSDAMVKQISAIPWLANSDVVLRELGYTDEQIRQLRSDRRRAQALEGAQKLLETNKAVTSSEDNAGGTQPIQESDFPEEV